MNRIEKGLHEHHARLAEQGSSAAAGQASTSTSTSTSGALEAPFAKVNSVVAGSPADSAGLKAGDNITKFGWVDWTNHEKLSRVAEAVSQNEGVSCPTSLLFSAWKLLEYFHARIDSQDRAVACTQANRTAAPNHRKSAAQQHLGRPSRNHFDAAHAKA